MRDFIKSSLGLKTKHFGVDLMMNVNDQGYDPEGNKVNGPDGDHGHLYIHYTPPTKDKPGCVMVGTDGAQLQALVNTPRQEL